VTDQYVGQRRLRVEDARLLRGDARFVADIRLPGMCSAVFVRSPLAHATIRAIDVESAQALPGVMAVLTAEDLRHVLPLTRKFYRLTEEFVAETDAIESGYCEPILAGGRVVRVGQAVAMVIAADRWIAEDARDLVEVDYEALPVVPDPLAALSEQAPLVDLDVPGNIHSQFAVRTGDVDAAESQADLIIERNFRFGRSVGAPIENRGVVGTWDDDAGLRVWSTTQIPFVLRSNLAECLSIPEHRIRVDVADMGGSFGGGIYVEEIAVAAVARMLRRPVSWIEDRSESLVNSRHSRDAHLHGRLALSKDGIITSLRVSILLDGGCANPFGLTLAHNIASHARSVYRIENFEATAIVALTNKTRNTPVRGAGRPEATFVIDRLIDIAAAELDIDPAAIRLSNLIPADAMPYPLGMPYRDGVAAVYDSGDFPAQFRRLLVEGDYAGWRDRQRAARAEGRFLGIGFSCHVEGTGLGPHEGARVRIERDGSVTLFSGAVPHGQSHQTVLAQVLADELGLDPIAVTVRTGNTADLPFGGGTFGSRSGVTASAAVQMAGESTRGLLLGIASDTLEIAAADLKLKAGFVVARDAPERRVSFADLAALVAPGPGRIRSTAPVELGALEYFVPPTVTFGSGSHMTVVEVDPIRWDIRFLEYVTVDDCGRPLNEMVVDGQVIGGLIHGISNALYEELIYDDQAQPVNASFVEYLLATAAESPRVRVLHDNHPTPKNPLGVKGIGEGSTSSAPAAVVNAICDALSMYGIDITEIPVQPWHLDADFRPEFMHLQGRKST
jgi:carbon-monoxide dehydrogenase large subunit